MMLQNRMKQTWHWDYRKFRDSKDKVFEENGKKFLHSINYLQLEFPTKTLLMLNEPCISFNETFWDSETDELTSQMKQHLQNHGFSDAVLNNTLYAFDSKQLEMDFYPDFKGYFLKDNEGIHYMLIGIQKYKGTDFTGLKLMQYTSPSFSFPHQDNYIRSTM